ncbi:family 61 endoglucanase [Diplocarpon rosae]|nr:family 61 endoglucanase [Diplocarpon rosae]
MKTATILPSLFALISAHGFVQQIWLGENVVGTWNPNKDKSKKGLNKITRKFDNNGPVTDGTFTTDAITCNSAAAGNNEPVTGTAEVAAGIMTYLASCNGPCSAFSGSVGNVWVKIDQSGYDAAEAVPWASKRLHTQNSTYTVTLPKTIAPGEYILRHEILGLQRTNTDGSLAQFYPGCHQITVKGSGTTKLPEGIALPGAYKADDTTSIFLEYRDVSASNPYTPPGGPVWGDNGWIG